MGFHNSSRRRCWSVADAVSRSRRRGVEADVELGAFEARESDSLSELDGHNAIDATRTRLATSMVLVHSPSRTSLS